MNQSRFVHDTQLLVLRIQHLQLLTLSHNVIGDDSDRDCL